MHLLCADVDQKLEEVILVHHYDLFLLNSGVLILQLTGKKEQANVCFFSTFQLVFLHFSLILRHKWMQDIHYGK